MNETQKAPEVVAEPVKDEADNKTIVEALLDIGATWAAHGLHAGRFSLENSARALERTAKSLEGLARQFEAKGKKNSTV